MRINAGNFHLTYCTNVHPGESWHEIFANIENHVLPLKNRLAPERPFGIGLRLSNSAARSLLVNGELEAFRRWLDVNGLYVFTLNGFPYGGFHQAPVKEQVFAPDWREEERLSYTRRLVRILAALLPPEMDGSISTVPLSYKPWMIAEGEREATLEACSLRLARLAEELASVRRETGREIHVDLEAEPDGLLGSTSEVCEFFRDWLIPIGARHISRRLGLAFARARFLLLRHIGVCYDACHSAIEFEHVEEAMADLASTRIRLGKLQISSALKVPLDTKSVATLAQRLHPFADGTYLHQVVERGSDGSLRHHRDLPEALSQLKGPSADEWRIHFHVPVFCEQVDGFASTQNELREVLETVRRDRLCSNLEIETYTWGLLGGGRGNLLQGLQKEYEWVLDQF